MNIILIGFKNSGKSTVGKLLAKHLNYQFIDTDRLLEGVYEKQEGVFLPIHAIFKKHGETFFRAFEAAIIQSLKELHDTVIACGGGTVANPTTAAQLKHLGSLVYLDVSKKILLERIATKARKPQMLDKNNLLESFERLYQERKTCYDSVADVCLKVSHDMPKEVLEKIVQAVF